MSILLGLYEESDPCEKCEEEDLLVFGYACKLFRDDSKALLEDSGQLLIPWMGDTSLMVDRYDIRNRLEDKSQFGLKPNFPHKMTVEEEELEEVVDAERYRSLGSDVREEELREEENKRQLKDTNNLSAVGFTYNQGLPSSSEEPAFLVSEPSLPEHPPTSSVDIGEDDQFTCPPGLVIPEGMKVPATNKLHSIIERTAAFTGRQGTQMEIIIKAKQKFNPFFSFLDFRDSLYPYYKHIHHAISTGAFTPQPDQPEEPTTKEEPVSGTNGEPEAAAEKGDSDSNDEDGSDDSDGDEFELHPLLRLSTTPKSSKSSTPVPVTEAVAAEEERHAIDSSAFYAKRLSVNAAPSLENETVASQSQDQYGTNSEAHSQQPYDSYTMEQGSHAGYYGGNPYYDAYAYQVHYQHNLQAYYHAFSTHHINTTPTPPPPDLQPIVDKTALYVARNNDGFERTVLEKHCDDPRFSFLNPWDKFHSYYKMKKIEHKEKLAQEEAEKENLLKSKNAQRLDPTGAVRFKLQSKDSKLVEPTVDLSVEEECFEEEEEGGGKGEDTDDGSNEPPPKRQHLSNEETGVGIDNQVQAFLTTVKAMFGTD